MFIVNESLRIIHFMWQALVHIWPLLLVTIPLAVIIKLLNISDHVHHLFSRNIGVSIFLATLVGAVSPFCSCGIIPVITALLISGVPLAPVMSFWLASPSMDPEIFFLSVGALGLPLAVARMVTTFLMSLAGGIIVHRLYGKLPVEDFLIRKPLKVKKNSEALHAAVFNVVDSPEEASDTEMETANENPITRSAMTHNKGLFSKVDSKEVLHQVITSTVFVLKFLLIAYFIEALIVFYLPESIMSVFLNTPDFISVMLASLISIPLYTTNISALGLVSGLMAKGMSGGPALSFLVGGATTTIPAMAAVYKIVDKRLFRVYVGTAIAFSLGSGLVYAVIEKM